MTTVVDPVIAHDTGLPLLRQIPYPICQQGSRFEGIIQHNMTRDTDPTMTTVVDLVVAHDT